MMRDYHFEVEVETVDAHGFEVCSKARGFEVSTLVKIVSGYRQSAGLLLERLRLNQEAFLNKKHDDHAFLLYEDVIANHRRVGVAPVKEASMEPPTIDEIEKIKSLKLNESAMKLHHLMLVLVLPTCGFEKFASVIKVEESKLFEIVSRYRVVMGSRLERLRKRQEELLLEEEEEENRYQYNQQVDNFKQEWDQIYTLLDQIPPKNRMKKTIVVSKKNITRITLLLLSCIVAVAIASAFRMQISQS